MANRSVRRGAAPGLVFIPDISGFTELVRSTDLITGQLIARELLATIIRHNSLGMQVAEIEGDAVFFYKWGPIPAVSELYAQFGRLKSAFDQKVAELRNKYHFTPELNLKAIAHYGEMAAYPIAGFRKLYGEVVIEAHRLLKNSIPGRSYLLITDALTAADGGNERHAGHDSLPIRTSGLCELYEGLSGLCFTYVMFETLKQAV